jgi:NAD(P)-dependent dehydrogenase (short-subunit alcohol dehydrogenase family)
MLPRTLSTFSDVDGIHTGIGRAVTIRFTREGCRKLFLVDLNYESLQETKQLVEAECELDNLVLHVANIADPDAVKRLVACCVDHFGRLDFAINNAGIALGGIKTADMSLEMFDKICEVNEKGVSDACVFRVCCLISLFHLTVGFRVSALMGYSGT